MDFINCDEGTTGQALADKLIEELEMCGHALGRLRGH